MGTAHPLRALIVDADQRTRRATRHLLPQRLL